MIVGHQKIIDFLDRSIEKNAISHAYIFAGPEHLGKFSIALDFAQKLTGNSKKINPDVIVIRPEVKTIKGISKEGSIKIETIREYQRMLGMTSYFGMHRVGIIDCADKMNKPAQNAMLKILEEPMADVILILIARDLNKILPTIISRCVVKKFSLVSEEKIKKIIPAGAKDCEEMIFWSLGRPGLAKSFLENIRELEGGKEAKKELAGLFDSNISDKFALAEKMSKDNEASIEKLGWWTVLLRENMIGRKKMPGCSSKKALQLLDNIQKSIELLRETNSNARLVLENLFLGF